MEYQALCSRQGIQENSHRLIPSFALPRREDRQKAHYNAKERNMLCNILEAQKRYQLTLTEGIREGFKRLTVD